LGDTDVQPPKISDGQIFPVLARTVSGCMNSVFLGLF